MNQIQNLFVNTVSVTATAIFILIAAGIAFSDPPDPCIYEDCPPKRCYYDLDCGIGCWCYKGQYDMEGVCVSD